MKERRSEDGLLDSWLWVVVLGTYMACFIVGGLCYSTGIYYAQYHDLFPDHGIVIAILSSSPSTLYFLMAPISLKISTKIGTCWTILLGGMIGTLGYFISFYIDDINLLCLTQGIVVGVGCGIVMAPIFCTMKQICPPKYYTFTNAFTLSGISLGYFTFPFISEALIKIYGIHGSLLITSGIFANISVVALTFRPFERDLKKIVPLGDAVLNRTNTQTLQIHMKNIYGSISKIILEIKNGVKESNIDIWKYCSKFKEVTSPSLVFTIYAFLEQGAGSIFLVMLPYYLEHTQASSINRTTASTLLSLTALGDVLGSFSIISLGILALLIYRVKKEERYKECHPSPEYRGVISAASLSFERIQHSMLFFLSLIVHLFVYCLFLVKDQKNWSLTTLTLAVIVYGFAYGARWALTNSVLIDMFGEDKFDQMTAYYFTGAGLGSIMGVTLATWISAKFDNIASMFYITTLFTLVALLLYFKLLMLAIKRAIKSTNKDEIIESVYL